MTIKQWKLKYLPEVYRISRPFSDDWALPWISWRLQPWCWVPRWWRFWPFPFPPRKVCGTQEEAYIDTQSGYLYAPDAFKTPVLPNQIWSIHPVGWGWSVQSCWFPVLGRLPCYFQWTRKVLGRKLHFNIGLRPDVTPGDWGWWFPEASIGWTKE